MTSTFVSARAERRAAPKPARIPSGDRAAYSRREGRHFIFKKEGAAA